MNEFDTLKVVLDDGAFRPVRAHKEDAGLDLFSREDKTVPARGAAVFDTGVHVGIPEGYVGFIKSKSGLNIKHGIVGEGVIDAGYTGAVVVKLYNHSDVDYKFARGDKITQLVILPIACPAPVRVSALNDTDRGEGGFGSTGK